MTTAAANGNNNSAQISSVADRLCNYLNVSEAGIRSEVERHLLHASSAINAHPLLPARVTQVKERLKQRAAQLKLGAADVASIISLSDALSLTGAGSQQTEKLLYTVQQLIDNKQLRELLTSPAPVTSSSGLTDLLSQIGLGAGSGALSPPSAGQPQGFHTPAPANTRAQQQLTDDLVSPISDTSSKPSDADFESNFVPVTPSFSAAGHSHVNARQATQKLSNGNGIGIGDGITSPGTNAVSAAKPAQPLSQQHASALATTGGTATALPITDGMLTPNSKAAKLVIRSVDENDLINLTYGSTIYLQSQSSDQYLVRSPPPSAPAPGNRRDEQSAPSLTLQLSQDDQQAFTLVNAKVATDTGVVRFHDRIYLLCHSSATATTAYSTEDTVFYVCAEKDGRLVLRGRNDVASTLTKCQFTLLPAQSAQLHEKRYNVAHGNVKAVDQVALRSCYQTYVTAPEQGAVHTNATAVDEQQVLVLCRCSIPHPSKSLQHRLHGPPDTHTHAQTVKPRAEQYISVDAYSKLPADVQEQLLIDHLLSALMGIDTGLLFREQQQTQSNGHSSSSSPQEYHVSDVVTDASHLSVLHRLLPLANHYAAIQHYIDVHCIYQYGSVQHAISHALQQIQQQYLILLTQLEQQQRQSQASGLTLLHLWYYIQPSLFTLQKVEKLCAALHGVAGGAALNVISTLIAHEGDVQSKQLYQSILTQAVQPYFQILHQWLTRGQIQDPYNEFFISTRVNADTASGTEFHSNWDEQYIVRDELVPSFLEEVSSQILMTGKYLNLIHECQQQHQQPPTNHKSQEATFSKSLTTPLQYSSTDELQYLTPIKQAYTAASSQLLSLLLGDYKLISHLHSIHRYFMLAQGDFLQHFLDLSIDELSRRDTECNLGKLDTMLEQSIRASQPNEAHLDIIGCGMFGKTLIQQLMVTKTNKAANEDAAKADAASSVRHGARGLDSLILRYRVGWPLSLVLSKKAITKYNLLFRLLLQCKYVERQLALSWRNQQLMKDLHRQTIAASTNHSSNALTGLASLSQSFHLRHRMYHFIRQLLYYMSVETIEPAFAQLLAKLATSSTVDDILQHHTAFIDTTLKQCLLTSSTLLTTLMRIFDTCTRFADQMERLTQTVHMETTASATAIALQASSGHRATNRSLQVQQLLSVVGTASFQQMLQQCSTDFNAALQQLLNYLRQKSGIQYDSYLANLLQRIDANPDFEIQSQRQPLPSGGSAT